MANIIRSNFQGREKFSLVSQGVVSIPDNLIISTVHHTLYDGITDPVEDTAVSTITIYGTTNNNNSGTVNLVTDQKLNLPASGNVGDPTVTVIKIPKRVAGTKIMEIWWEIMDNGYLEDIESQTIQLSGTSVITNGMINS